MTEQSIALLEDALVIELDVDADQARRILDYLMAAGLLADRRLAECAVCRRPFVDRSRAHARIYCSEACRQSLWRQRRLPEQIEHERIARRVRVAARRAAA